MLDVFLLYGYAGYGMLFKWSEYLVTPGKIPAPAHLFKKVMKHKPGVYIY